LPLILTKILPAKYIPKRDQKHQPYGQNAYK
jgi:hypothetical protein